MKKNILIGVAGPIGSGKGIVVDWLKDKGFVSFSLSDEIREELRSRDQEITRASLQATGNQLRAEYGNEVLAKRALARINHDHKGMIVIESIRNPDEAHFLKTQANFHLIHVTADQETRFERIKKRKRSGDMLTWAKFLEEDEEESMGHHGEHSQLVDETAKLAHFVVDNSGSLEDTYLKLEEIYQKIIHES